jgi:small subunit ribosomal protein S9
MPEKEQTNNQAEEQEKADSSQEVTDVDIDNEYFEEPKFKGKYITAIGRRKSAVARVRLYKKGTGAIVVNDRRISGFFPADKVTVAKQPLRQASLLKEFNFSVVVKGGGTNGQAEAVRHGIARALVEYDEGLKAAFKARGWISRDDRTKERKKPGLKKARRAPQWSKR